MALVTHISEVTKERNQLHEEVDCSFSIFSEGHERILQLDTYGRPGRAFTGKVSQSIQFNRDSAAVLKRLIERAFPDLK